MASRLLLSNDANTAPQGQGIVYDDDNIYIPLLANEASAHGAAAATLVYAAGPMPQAGKVVDFQIGVTKIAVSASGFISANVSANLRINSVSCLSTLPAIVGPAASAGLAVAIATNNFSAANSAVSGVVNGASAAFAKGDRISIDWVAGSAGSAAAGAAGTGAWAKLTVRYDAQ